MPHAYLHVALLAGPIKVTKTYHFGSHAKSYGITDQDDAELPPDYALLHMTTLSLCCAL